MPKVQKNLVNTVKTLADTVKQDLFKKGVVVPVKNKDGSVSFGDYIMTRRGLNYWISKRGHDLVGPINLAQTAIVTANYLALGKMADDKLLENDRWYGFKNFDEEVYTNSANNSLKNKNYDRADWCFVKASIAKMQKEQYRSSVMSSFNRLKLS
jgi:hypothetical protein